jgi:hypothetical protein
MKPPVIVIGIGEMGSVFARGFLRIGYPVYPVNRDTDLGVCAANCPDPELVLVAVAEGDLQLVLDQIPVAWEDRLCLLQNELLPRDWAAFDNPTVISVWFEKKRGMDSKPIVPSPVYGPHAGLVARALGALDIPTRELDDPEALVVELVIKNLYILTSNICGLEVGGSVGELWARHQDLASRVAGEVIRLQEALTGKQFERESLIQGMLAAFEGDPKHQCMGRSAPARLARALEQAAAQDLDLPTLQDLQARHGS